MSSIFKKKETLNIECKKTVEEEAFILAKIQKLAFESIYKTHKDSASPYLRGPEDIMNKASQNKRYLCYTIFCDSQIVGCIIVRVKGSTPFLVELSDNECYLQRIYVDPKMQRRGIAENALEQIMARMREIGKTKMFVDFPIDLSANKSFYESVGFIDTGRTEEVEPKLILSQYVKRI